MALSAEQIASINSSVVGARERRNLIAFGELLALTCTPATHIANPSAVTAMGAVTAPGTWTQAISGTYTKSEIEAIVTQVDAMTDKIIELQPIVAKVNEIQPLVAKVTALIAALETAGLMATS